MSNTTASHELPHLGLFLLFSSAGASEGSELWLACCVCVFVALVGGLLVARRRGVSATGSESFPLCALDEKSEDISWADHRLQTKSAWVL